MKRLLAVTEGPDFVCYRYRIEAFRRLLADRGWHLELLPHVRSAGVFMKQMRHIAAADAVVLQRRLYPWPWRWLIRQAAKVLIYDFDDAVFLRDSNSRKPAANRSRLLRFRRTVRMADACLAGNEHLRDHAAEASRGAQVHLVPTCVDPGRYRLAEHRRVANNSQLVWIGSRSTATSLVDAREALVATSRTLPGITLKTICDFVPRIDGVHALHRPWSNETEAEDLAQGDIGVAWFPDHPWSLGKCGLKVLQYMAAGLPVVANPLGIHRELVVHGETGFLASTASEWAEAIARLAKAPERRRQMGLAARERVVNHFSVSRWGPRLVEIVDELCATQRRRHLAEANA